MTPRSRCLSSEARIPRSRCLTTSPRLERASGTAPPAAARRSPRCLRWRPTRSEPEDLGVTGLPEDHQGGHHRQAPDQVVEECLAAAAEREERITPAVLQHQAGDVMPRAVNAAPASRAARAAASATTPAMRPADEGGRRAAGDGMPPHLEPPPLNRTISGSVEIPREALSANP